MLTPDYGPDPFRRGEAEDRLVWKMIYWVVGMVVTAAFLFGMLSWYQRFVVQTATESAAKMASALQKHAQDVAAQAQARAEREKAERAAAQRRTIEAENARIAAAQERRRP
jgi:cell division septum initiation protein DivIVA